MLLRLLSIVVLLTIAQAVVENPCKAKQTTGCKDLATTDSCEKIFLDGTGQIQPSCYDKTNADFVFSSNCRATCQLCCQEPEFDCADDPLPGIDCPIPDQDGNVDEISCSRFSDENFQHCQSSCGWCNKKAAPCVDYLAATDCAPFKAAPGDLCTTDAQVKVFCAKTCGACITEDCDDASTRCPIWVGNGFCTDPFYTAGDSVSTYCKKSCDLC
ncbi:hypothetical protein PENTCL1PPCAC_19365 [Pristionchus entomophagus]|uniref:ShKT domain-containing protein n=1 Tax=Pristionchus entomophagus TaxID=358040 RepID=A0AAV5TRR5_9BILA|nr:hypothetical protein PENTCL1PPCAC_19365 [Pristionchus entomophagus]